MGFISSYCDVFDITREELIALTRKVIDLWPEVVSCEGKKFGPCGEYSSYSLIQTKKDVDKKLDEQDWGKFDDIVGIVDDFVGSAIKDSSRYLKTIRVSDLDLNMIISNVGARDEINVGN